VLAERPSVAFDRSLVTKGDIITWTWIIGYVRDVDGWSSLAIDYKSGKRKKRSLNRLSICAAEMRDRDWNLHRGIVAGAWLLENC
jgi:hypothetical protein